MTEENSLSAQTVREIVKFRDDRDWRQFHNPKDLALSVSVEAAELLECFQWSGADTEVPKKREAIKEELADVVIYAVLLSERMGINLDEAVRSKLAQNAAKYPVSLARGSSAKYTELKARVRSTDKA